MNLAYIYFSYTNSAHEFLIFIIVDVQTSVKVYNANYFKNMGDVVEYVDQLDSIN